jgi:hypothetical protein
MRSSYPLGYRLFKMSLPTGVLISLPLLLVVAWYSWSAYAQVDRYLRAVDDVAPWSLELFHIALHDELARDLRRVTLVERPATSALPTFSLSLTRDNFDKLNQQLYSRGRRPYVNGYIKKDGVVHDVEVRYRGSKPWHWLGAQKSLKFRLKRGDLIDGAQIFNLLNGPTPFGMEDHIILDLVRDLDLLTPEYYMARLRLNNSDMGVYNYAVQPVEGLLRRGRRMSGALYSGDTDSVDAESGVGGLFFSRDGWKQVTRKLEGDAEEFVPLDRLLTAVQSASHADFATFADAAIDLERYAAFDALDVVFGGNEHDYFSNHKLYFDPYRGKFEPVAWGFRGFRHEPVFNLIDHPLLIRLKMTPGYLARRNRAVFELLVGQASASQVRTHANRLFEEMAPDLDADPYWDAYKLLPRVSRFHRFMVRPMSKAKSLLAAQAEMHDYSRRVRYLLDALEQPSTAASAHALAPQLTRVDLVVDGPSAQRLREVAVAGPCDGAFVWRADIDRDGLVGDNDPLVAAGVLGASSAVSAYADLLAGARLVPRSDPQAKRGLVSVEPESRTYTYLLTTACPPSEVALVLDNQVTGGSTRLALAVRPDEAPASIEVLPPAASVPTLAAGQRSSHLWDFSSESAPEMVHLGPGVVQVKATRIYRSHQNIVIAAGTRIELAPAASLVFEGKVHAHGTLGQPIVFAAAQADQPFGGIAIQGPAAAGSSLQHIRVEGGTLVGDLDVNYPSLFNIYDTRDITIEAAHFSAISVAEDVLHATYVRNIRLHEIEITQAPIDGIDLEFTDGEVRGIRVIGAGDDCLDLMGVDLRVVDSILQDCTNNAMSVGEESEVNAHGLFISDSETGVLAKNASHARIARSLIYRTATALKTKRRDVYYAGDSSIDASDLFVASCNKTSDRARGSRIETTQVRKALPTQGALDHLAQHVLGLSGWDGFGSYMTRLRQGNQL